MMMHTLGMELSGSLVAVIAVSGGMLIALVSVIASAVSRTSQAKAREQTKREVAAYVAEGSMSPEQAQQILASGKGGSGGCCGGHG